MKNREPFSRDLQTNRRVYSFMFVPFEELGYLNVYGSDITLRKNLESELRRTAIRPEILKGARLLIAEDNKLNQYFITTLLKHWQVEHDIADNGEMAVELITRNRYDLVFMDLEMPVMGGYQAAAKIRKEVGSQVPIVALSANALEEYYQMVTEAGMNDFLVKPYKPEDLFEKIVKVLGISL